MSPNQSPYIRILVCGITLFPILSNAWQPGTYPAAPQRMHSLGFSVNNQDRNDVVAFWHAVYQASEGYQSRINWTGNYSGNSGTVSQEFVNDVERRLNYFRAMCGVGSSARVNSGSTVTISAGDAYAPSLATLKSSAAQDAALMLSRNYNSTTGSNPAITHNPPSGLAGWSPAAWNACAKGNLAFGLFGPGAIDEYVIERFSATIATSSWNTLVGHRRWSLYPDATDFATGDQPGTDVFNPPTNILYVIQKPGELVAPSTPGFVAYPAAGFFPAAVNSSFWSLSHPTADFSSATVQMTNASGGVVPVGIVRRDGSFGDPALIWEVNAAAAVRSVSGDTTFNVLVSGIGGSGTASSHSYSVTLIDPNVLTSDQAIYGPATVASSQPATYTFTPPAGNESLKVAAYLKSTGSWKENAENAAGSRVVDGTAASYPLKVKPTSFRGFGPVSGRSSFRLTFPTLYDPQVRGVPEQSFELGRDVIVAPKASVNFKFRRGYMTSTSFLVFEMSANGGGTWSAVGRPIRGVSNTKYDMKVSVSKRALPVSSNPVRFRFRYYTTGGSIFTHSAGPKLPTGIFIDDIDIKGCSWLDQKAETTLANTATSFVFDSQTAGAPLVKGSEWYLSLRTQLGGKWFPDGPSTRVMVTAP